LYGEERKNEADELQRKTGERDKRSRSNVQQTGLVKDDLAFRTPGEAVGTLV